MRFLEMNESQHCVYHIFDKNELIYVGRSINPRLRLQVIQRKTQNYTLTQKIVLLTTDFELAADAERSDIRRLKPRLNKHVVSSRGMLGASEQSKAKTSASMLGNLNCLGNLCSDSTRAKIGAANSIALLGNTNRRGHKCSAATIEKIRAITLAYYAKKRKRR